MDPPADEVVVVDQSVDDRTARALAPSVAARAVRYFRQAAVGLSRARNLGVAEAKGDILAFTDDDCEVVSNFGSTIREAFGRHPQAGILFGRVDAEPCETTRGLVPHCGRDHEFVARTIADCLLLGGMGACMAIRRDCFQQLGGFDVCLGAGALFPAAEETDMAVRALAAGIPVVETPSVRVTHHGFRIWSELETLSDHYLHGTGAMFGKHLRLWPGRTTLLLLRLLPRWAVGKPRISYLREPRRLARLLAFSRGWARGIRTRLDRERGHFIPPG
jgi:GT2 family glycosyltransferase